MVAKAHRVRVIPAQARQRRSGWGADLALGFRLVVGISPNSTFRLNAGRGQGNAAIGWQKEVKEKLFSYQVREPAASFRSIEHFYSALHPSPPIARMENES